MPEFIEIARRGDVATITLNRPQLHNAFNEVMMKEITNAFSALSEQRETRAVILAAAGKSFSAGADINWMKRMVDYSFEENVEDSRVLAHMLQTIRRCSKPVIARVHGATFGGGVGLVAACDMAIAVERAFFCLSEVKLGILPAVISPYVLEKIGIGHARRFCLTAEHINSAEAQRVGLVSQVADSESAMDDAIEAIIAAIRKNGPEAVAACKSVLDDVADFAWERATELTIRRIAERRVSDEGQEGLKAFLEKRDPAWIQTDR